MFRIFFKKTMSSSKRMSNEEWKVLLSPEQFRVLREKGTERPGTGKYIKFYESGVYNCLACDNPLYTSNHKFNSSCGWPCNFI